MIHILPFADSEEHEETVECKCKPRLIEIGKATMVLHNPFDGREQIDWTLDPVDKDD